METKAFEIDFIEGGENSRCCDAIALRYGIVNYNRFEQQKVIVIDGGTKQTGEKLLDLIKNTYQSKKIDLLISTHPDSDHSCGACLILENMKVDRVLMHRPWANKSISKDLFIDGRITNNSIKEHIKELFEQAYKLEQLAKSKNIPIDEPFAGYQFDNGIIKILGPDPNFYLEMFLLSTKTPDSILNEAKNIAKSIISKSISFIQETIDPQSEKLGNAAETIDEYAGGTSPINNTSVITLFTYDNLQNLFTGDSGVPALHRAFDYSLTNSIHIPKFRLFQVPHHGSKHNMSSNLFSRFSAENAFISASKDGDPKHPSRKVCNAFYRRNIPVYITQGSNIRHHHNAPARPGHNSIQPIAFFNQVEE